VIIPIGPIDSECAETVAQAVASRPTDIHLLIDSRGGTVGDGLEIYHRLRNFDGTVTAHVVRRCFSSAVTVLCAARKRSAAPLAQFLLHETNHEFSGRMTSTEIARQLPVLCEIDANVRSIITAATGCDPKWLESEERTEDELGIVEAMRHGLIHEVKID
jgi:ATP-dependent protease ClpP protease subunit